MIAIDKRKKDAVGMLPDRIGNHACSAIEFRGCGPIPQTDRNHDRGKEWSQLPGP